MVMHLGVVVCDVPRSDAIHRNSGAPRSCYAVIVIENLGMVVVVHPFIMVYLSMLMHVLLVLLVPVNVLV